MNSPQTSGFRPSLVLALLALVTAGAFGQTTDPAPTPIPLDLPLFEAPYNLQVGYEVPSMAESLAATISFDRAVFFTQERFFSKTLHNFDPAAGSSALLAYFFILETLVGQLPLGDAWLHESFHQAILKTHGINSYNDIYKFQLFSSVIAVSHVADADLAALKATSNPDFVRLSASGIEGTSLLASELSQATVFEAEPWWTARLAILLSNQLNTTLYIFMCTTPAGNTETDKMNRAEANTIDPRDFVGLDFTAWTHDLFHPAEPYNARGPHPYGGLGINRYISPSQLSPEELSYLQNQALLSLLSLVDTAFSPVPITLRSAEGPDLVMGGNLRYFMTSFGNAVQVNTFFRRDDLKLGLSFFNFNNRNAFFPGLEVKLVDLPLNWAGLHFTASPRLQAWLQPKQQSFTSSEVDFGGLLSLRINYLWTAGASVWLEGLAKSPGWVAGNEHLDADTSLRAGLTWRY